MLANGTQAVLVTDLANVQWLSGFRGSAGIVVVTPTDARFLTDSRYTIAASEQVQEMPSFSFTSPVKGDDFLAFHLKEMGIHSIAFEADQMTYRRWQTLSEALKEIELNPKSDLFSKLRMVKSDTEIKKIREACKLADACFSHITKFIQPGATEYDLNLEIEFFFRRNGAGLAFEPIVVSGEKSARPHGKASDKKLEKGDFLTMDFGANLDGQCSDLTRTVLVGECSDRSREVYEVVLKAQLDSIAAMKPGSKASEIDAIARKSMGDFAQYFGHGLGHGLGAVVHDAGRLASTSEDILEVNQIWTVEPGVYIPGFGGVRIEDDVLVTENGVELLTHSPKQLMILP